MDCVNPMVIANVYMTLSHLFISFALKKKFPQYYIINDAWFGRLYRAANPVAKDLAFFCYFIINENDLTIINPSARGFYCAFVFVWPLLHPIVIFLKIRDEICSILGQKTRKTGRREIFAKATGVVDAADTLVEFAYILVASLLLANTYKISVGDTKFAFLSMAWSLAQREVFTHAMYGFVWADCLCAAWVPGKLLYH